MRHTPEQHTDAADRTVKDIRRKQGISQPILHDVLAVDSTHSQVVA